MVKKPRTEWDVIIVGGGPGGLTTGIYTGRARLDTLILERGVLGGQIVDTYDIENYPGLYGISGKNLIARFARQAKHFGVKIRQETVVGVRQDGDRHYVKLRNGEEISARALVLATGAEPGKLSVPGEREFTGRGVSYCATCDGALYGDAVVAVVGGRESALVEALFLAKFAREIHVFFRESALREVAKTVLEKVEKDEKIILHPSTAVEAIEGNMVVERVQLRNVKTKERWTQEAEGVFVYVRTNLNTEFLKDYVQVDERGRIVTDAEMRTSRPGVFACGDVRVTIQKQVATAVGDGAMAAAALERYLEGLEKGSGTEKGA